MSLIQTCFGKERRFRSFLLRNNTEKRKPTKVLDNYFLAVPASRKKQTHMLFSQWRTCLRTSLPWEDADGLMFWLKPTGSTFGEEKQSLIFGGCYFLIEACVHSQPCRNRGRWVAPHKCFTLNLHSCQYWSQPVLCQPHVGWSECAVGMGRPWWGLAVTSVPPAVLLG